jgi:hypothetical protein
MAENGSNGNNGTNGANGKDGRDQDPSALSVDLVMREIEHLRELFEARFAQVDGKFEESDKAVGAALDASQKAVVELDSSITRRLEAAKEVVEAKYVTYRTLLDSNAQKVEAALVAADKAVSAAFASSKEAINKAESSVEKRFDLITKQIDELKSFQSTYIGRDSAVPTTSDQIQRIEDKVNSLGTYRDSAVGSKLGASSLWGYIIGGISFVISVVLFIMIITGK